MTRLPGIGRRDYPWLLSLLLVGCLASAGFVLHAQDVTSDQGGVPLDDAWIHFQFARNLANGEGFSFNPGEPTAGSTAPLWTLLLAGIYLLGGGFPVTGQLLSVISFLLSIVATYVVAKRLTTSGWMSWLASILVAVNGRFVWAALSAQEVCLFAAVSLMAVNSHLTDRAQLHYRGRSGLLFGLAALLRPEGYLLFALAMVDFCIVLARQPRQSRSRWPIIPVLVFIALVLPYILFSLHTSGHLLPNTFHAKVTPGLLPSFDYLSVAATYLVLDNPATLPFFLLGLILLLRKAPLLSLWTAGLVLVYGFLHVDLYQHGRYLMPLIPFNAIIAVIGIIEARAIILRRRGRFELSPIAKVALLILVVTAAAWRLPIMASNYGLDVTNINDMHVTLGHWLDDNTPDRAIVALNDIGAITYISERQVVDLAGLITPEVQPLLRSPDRDELLVEFLIHRDVEYVVIFPNWFPGLAKRTDLLNPIYEVTLEQRTITGGTTMVVYSTNW